jgi:hypothetical protein
MAYIKGSIKKGSDVIYPATALDKIYAVSGKSSSSAGTSILTSGTSKISSTYLPDTIVYTVSGTIPIEKIPTLTASYLPSNLVYTTNNKIPTTYITFSDATAIAASTSASPGDAVQAYGLKAYLDSHVAVLDNNGHISKECIPSSVDDIIQLVAYSANAPTGTWTTGDQYYNSTSKKIFTYESSGWGTTGTTPVTDVIYFVVTSDSKRTYRWSGAATNPDMVEIAAAIAITKQGSSSASVLTASDDYVPSNKAVKTAIELAASGAVSIASGSTPGKVYVVNASSSANGVTLSLNTTSGALSVTGVPPKKTSASAYTPGVVYIEGTTNSTTPSKIEGTATKGVKLILEQNTGKLSVTGVAAGNSASDAGVVYVSGGTSASNGIKLILSSGELSISATAANASGGYGVVTLEDDFKDYASGGWNTNIAVTPRAVKAWTEKILAGDGLQVSPDTSIASIKLASNSGLSCNSDGLKVGTLTGTMVASGLTKGTGIASITGGTITADLSFVADT